MTVLALAGIADDWGGNATDSFNSIHFDSNYTDRAVQVPNGGSASVDWRDKTSSGAIWTHFRFRTGTSWSSSNADGDWCRARSADGSLIWFLDVSNGDNRLVVYSNGSTNSATTYDLSLSSDTFYNIDIRHELSGGTRTVDVYVDGALSLTRSITGATEEPVEFIATQADINDFTHYSEFIVRDNDDSTIGIRVAKLKGDAAGNYTDGSGSFSDLDEVGVTGLQLSAGDRYSYSLANLGVSPTAIQGVFVNHRADTPPAGPASLEPFVRISATDYDNPDLTIDPAVQMITEFTQNPATLADWTEADVNALEYGILAVA